MNGVARQVRGMFIIAGFAGLLIGACVEFFNIASGTGIAIGDFSITWLVLFFAFILFCLALFVVLIFGLRGDFSAFFEKLILFRNRMNFWRWVLAILALAFPVWFLRYSMWGIVFHGIYIRTLIWIASVIIFSVFASRDQVLMGWQETLSAIVFTASAFMIAISLQGVTDYPFSLGWSEGNRLWDYSTFFGSSLYIYPSNQDIYVLSDPGRLLVGGLPFLFPGITIEMARLWVGLTMIIPYFLVGIAAYRNSPENRGIWFFIILWIFLFLKQGPIHAPLVLCAALTVLVWRRSLWVSIPMVIIAGYFAQASRYTWMFAPGIWIGVLELADASLRNGKLTGSQWTRSIAVGISGLAGGYLLPKLIPLFRSGISLDNISVETVENVGEQIAGGGYTPEIITSEVTRQPLLWYRLLPNSTYGTGILVGLLIAVMPLLTILLWLVITKKWVLNLWQKLALSGSLLAFLAVGLVASTKIGGGGDLHNLDMFLIGLAFAGIVAWYNGGREAILNPDQISVWMKVVIIAVLVIPAIGPLRQMRSLGYGEKAAALAILVDAPSEKSLDILPSDEKVNSALAEIQDAVSIAREDGDVLFLDQRQLLTFGYISDLPLVPEYEKKVLMNQALSADVEYFHQFYEDLAAGRFSLIVSEKLYTSIKNSSFEFGEENNAWVTWVAEPILCYYKTTRMSNLNLNSVGVQLLIPRETPVDCQLP